MKVPRRVVRAGQGIVVAAILFGVYRALAPDLSGLSWRDVTALRPRPAPILLATLLLSAMNVAHAFLWRRIMQDLVVGSPDVAATLRVYFVASLGRYLPGKLWQLAGVAMLSRRAGLPGGAATACAVIGQLGFVVSGLLLLALLLPESGSGMAGLAGASALIAAAVGVWVLLATRAGHGAREWLRRRLPAADTKIGAAFDLADRVRPRRAVIWLVGYGLSWVGIGIAFTLFVSGFVPGAAASVRELSGAIAASYLAGFLALVPAGLGVREAALSLLLAQIPAVPVAAALVIAVLQRVWFTVAEILPLAVLPFLGPGTTSEEAA
jgi:hypothetical protein